MLHLYVQLTLCTILHLQRHLPHRASSGGFLATLLGNRKHRCEASDHGISQGAEVESSVCDQFHGRAESRRGRGNPEQRAVCDAFVRARAAAAAFDDFGAGESWRRVVCASHGGAGSYHCASCLVHVLLCAEWHPLQSCLDQAEQLIDPSASIVGVLLAGVAMLC